MGLCDGSPGSSVGGRAVGPQVTDWLSVPSADGVVQVHFYSDGSNCCPSGTSIDCNPSTCTQFPSYPYLGTVVSSFDYRRYQTGASPVTIPLRSPGQYHDEETDLFENWHRYYDADIGRYLQPDPTLSEMASMPRAGAANLQLKPYAYTDNDPLRYSDPEGWGVADPGLPCEPGEPTVDCCVGTHVLDPAVWAGECGADPGDPWVRCAAAALAVYDACTKEMGNGYVAYCIRKKERAYDECVKKIPPSACLDHFPLRPTPPVPRAVSTR